MATKRPRPTADNSPAAKRRNKADSKEIAEVVKFVDDLKYLNGWGNHHATEALEGALPPLQNTPQKCNYNLYAEQLSGSSFTTPRLKNQRSWVYRITPSCVHEPFKRCRALGQKIVADFAKMENDPNQTRWCPFPLPAEDEKVNFLQGWKTLMGAGSADTKSGVGIHVYTCNTSMSNESAFCNSDGDLLIVPQLNGLKVRTEFGRLNVAAGEICVIPRGIKFHIGLFEEGSARGYMCEIFDGHFTLPDLGPIGANGLANGRDFKYPVADYEDCKGEFKLYQKYLGDMFEAKLRATPFDVVAWHGNYAPYKYNLDDFCAVNSVTYDHLDPSIFTVLTCATNEPGVAALDFVIFPPRWLVQDHTFRPPYYHKNCMSEFMGNLRGKYDAKPTGFLPGGGSLHSIMVGHGPDADTYKKASSAPLDAVRMEDAMAFMFESTYFFRLTPYAKEAPREEDYYECWQSLEHEFDASAAPSE